MRYEDRRCAIQADDVSRNAAKGIASMLAPSTAIWKEGDRIN